MTPDRDDTILDAYLDEVLAGHGPPDLTPRILDALAAGGHGRQLDPPEPPPILASLPLVLDASCSIPPLVVRRDITTGREHRRKKSSTALAIGLAAGVVGLGIAVGVFALLRSSGTQVAHSPKATPAQGTSGASDIVAAPKTAIPKTDSKASLLENSSAVQQLVQQQPESSSAPQTASSPPPEPPVAASSPSPAVASDSPNNRNLRPSPDAQIVSFVNAEMSRGWAATGVKPTPPATDAEWCQRLFARVLGRVPTAEELKALADDKATNRRQKLVDRLLTQADYAEEYARHWSGIWSSVFLSKSSVQPGSQTSREELEKYFATALSANKPFDQIAQDLLTATGSARPSSEDYNPAVNFLINSLDANATVATSRVARVLLGHQLQCAQCHAHPTQDWKQEQFWALNAFLRQMRVEQQGGSPRLVNVDFRGAGNGDVFYETPEGLGKTAFPRFIDGTEIPASGELATVDRRRELARLVVQSDDLPKALVNRLWAQFFDYGFTRPVDDIGPHSAPAQGPVFDRLATELAAHDFDLKRLIRWTVLSEAFARSSKLTDLASKDMPEEGEPALFSRYYARPPRAAEAFNSLVQASRIRRTSATNSDVEKARIDWLAQYNRGPAKAGKAAKAGTSPLLLKTDDPIHRSASGDPTGLVKRIAASSMSFEKKVEHVFLTALARQPQPRERRAAEELLRADRDSQAAALDDLWWALQNSSECVLDQ